MATKVLCLHGCNQDVDMFKSILKSMTKIGEKQNLEFHFMQAEYPHQKGGWTWYSEELDVSRIPEGIPYADSLVKDCMERLHKYITDNNIEVLLGFSQGGNVVDTYLRKNTGIKRAMIFSGYELVDPNPSACPIPMVSVFSEADTIVPTRCRPKHYDTLYEYRHDKGHKFPTGNPLLRRFCTFMAHGTWEDVVSEPALAAN